MNQIEDFENFRRSTARVKMILDKLYVNGFKAIEVSIVQGEIALIVNVKDQRTQKLAVDIIKGLAPVNTKISQHVNIGVYSENYEVYAKPL